MGTFDDAPTGLQIETVGETSGGSGILHGPPGVGKSTIGAMLSGGTSPAGGGANPNPIGLVVDCENGVSHYQGTRRVVPMSEQHLLEIFFQFGESKDPAHRVLFVDTISQFVINHTVPGICKQYNVASLGEVPFGKGPGATEKFARQYSDACEYLASKGRWVITVCHSQIKAVNDPTAPAPYDRHTLKLPQPMAEILTERADFVAFAHRAIITRTSNSGRTVAIGAGGGGGERLVQFCPTPSVLAKSRLGHPEEPLPLRWESFGITV